MGKESTKKENGTEVQVRAEGEKDTSIDEDSLNNRIEELKAEISRLEKSDCAFRMQVVDLHTTIQERDARIHEIEGEAYKQVSELAGSLDTLKRSMSDVTSIVGEWMESDKQPVGNLLALAKIAEVLYALDKKVEPMIDDSSLRSSDDIPAVVSDAAAEIERRLGEGLPDGVSVKVVAQPISPKQMVDMLKQVHNE